jgi:tRNA U34 5-carboxymethylaminomethyl modifying enzyme MnmG/GidA
LSVGQASRIAGVRNSDVAVLLVYLTKKGGA